jgi:hypothetical protein
LQPRGWAAVVCITQFHAEERFEYREIGSDDVISPLVIKSAHFTECVIENVSAKAKYLHEYLNSIPEVLLLDLITQWSRILLEKLTDPQLVNKFPAF